MTEAEIRSIVRDELDEYFREKRARDTARWDQYEAKRQAGLAEKPSDGQVASHIKAILRGEL